jgi:endonuclease I
MNVREVLNKTKEKSEKTKVVIRKIIENIHKKIKFYAGMNKDTCIYLIPPVVDDVILYDLQNIIKEIYKVLDKEDYVVTTYTNGSIHICWNEKLVKQKIKTDLFLIKQEESKVKNLKKKKEQNSKFEYLANPKKVIITEDSLLDKQIEKILKQKQKTQDRFSSLMK